MTRLAPFESIFFDLDGTLIDSAPSILESFRLVLDEAGLSPQVPLDAALIGPPLRQTLMKITGLAAGAELEGLAASFQCIYDNEGYRATRIYPGVEALLAALAASGIPLAIATNKRRVPTLKILKHLGWDGFFQQIGTLDGMSRLHADKASLLAHLLDEVKDASGTSLYLGDKWEDGEAAAANRMLFVAVDWGYGKWDVAAMPADWHLIRTPQELMDHLVGAASTKGVAV